jgi:hypothetical protein
MMERQIIRVPRHSWEEGALGFFARGSFKVGDVSLLLVVCPGLLLGSFCSNVTKQSLEDIELECQRSER